VTHADDASFRGRIAEDGARQQTMTVKAANGSGMDAGNTEFNMTMTRTQTQTLDTKHSTSALETCVVQSMDACDRLQEFNMETQTNECQPTRSAITTSATTMPMDDAASPEMILAATQLLQELKLTTFPPAWEDPTVMPLLKEVLDARTKKISIARKRREKRRENRRK